MSFKNFSRSLTALALLVLACATFASAQTPPTATGKVELKQADGTKAPVAGATVTFYRTDQKGTFNVKTDKGGRYVRVGFPFGATYTIVVSAPGARPTYLTNQNSNRLEDINFVLDPGDGSTLTLDQIRSANAASGTGGTNPATTATAQPTPDPKAVEAARAADAARANAESNDAKVDQLFASGNKALTAGMAARKAKNTDEAVTLTTQAIEFYDQGIQINAQAAELHMNKSVALRERGVARFNSAKDAAGRTTARQDFKTAVDEAELAVSAARAFAAKRAAQPSTTAGAAPATSMLDYLSARFESYRIALQASVQDIAEKGATAIREYIEAETDATKKQAAQVSYGSALLQAGKTDESIAAYRQALAANASNYDAMYGLGIALSTVQNDSKALAESKTMLQQFISKAPQNHPEIASAKEALAGVESALNQNNGGNRSNTGGGRRRP